MANANDEITPELLEKIREHGIDSFDTLYINELNRGPYISDTLRLDETPDQLSARIAIYRMMRPANRLQKKLLRHCSVVCSSIPKHTICPASAA